MPDTQAAVAIPRVDPDTDDRLPCACDGDMHGTDFKGRCPNRTRHESGLCGDCRIDDELELRAAFGDR